MRKVAHKQVLDNFGSRKQINTILEFFQIYG
jgi:hypothetical protein